MILQYFLPGFFLCLITPFHVSGSSQQQLSPIGPQPEYNEDVLCKSVLITNIKDFNKLQNCTVITGHVRIVNLVINDPEDYKAIVPSKIEEITDYLIVYRTMGLDSLERLFPNLIFIRGAELLFNRYSLVILENLDMKNVGLIELRRILKGSVRIESNPSLCFVHTINWVWILGKATKMYHYVLKNNKSPNQCPLCHNYNDVIQSQNQHKNCWSYGKLQQREILSEFNGNKCATLSGTKNTCGIKGCDGKGRCCTGNCLTSCDDRNCKHCIGHTTNRNCSKSFCLPPYISAFNRQCVKNCSTYGLYKYGSKCVDKCPKLYQQLNDSCIIKCSGNFTINGIQDLEGLQDCVNLKGSVTIELLYAKEKIIEALDQAFANLREISDYLKIVRSPQLLSLTFLKKLESIQGKRLINNKYALYVVDNHHLEDLWNHNQNVVISKGSVYFHLNPRLCYEQILTLNASLMDSSKITITDVSPNSNGERVTCGNAVRELNVTHEDVSSTSARLKVDLMPYEDKEALIGYIYYYKEAPLKNVGKYDGRHGCGYDSWFMDISPTSNIRHVIKNLKPFTQYAYFAKTLTITSYHNQIDAISEIHYLKTLPAKPGMIDKIYYHATNTTKMDIHWWPPKQPNGNIKNYIIRYEIVNVTMPSTDIFSNRNSKNPDYCACPKVAPESSGATPNYEHYYNKEQLEYDEDLANLIYIPAPKEKLEERQKKDDFTNLTLEGEKSLQIIHERMVNEYVKEQDTGITDFPLFNVTKPLCLEKVVTTQYLLENNCTPKESYEGIRVEGNLHTYTLTNLQPAVTYRIWIRACVQNLDNGCGRETSILAETLSERIENIIESLTLKKY